MKVTKMRYTRKTFKDVPEEYKDLKQVVLTDYNKYYVLLENGKIWSKVAGKFVKTYSDDRNFDMVVLTGKDGIMNTTINHLMKKYFQFENLFEGVNYKPVVGLEDRYLALEDGRIYSLRHFKFITPSKTKTGWSIVSILNKEGKRFTAYPARLVYEAFNGPIKQGYCISFKDKNKTNCSLKNLDVKENIYKKN